MKYPLKGMKGFHESYVWFECSPWISKLLLYINKTDSLGIIFYLGDHKNALSTEHCISSQRWITTENRKTLPIVTENYHE